MGRMVSALYLTDALTALISIEEELATYYLDEVPDEDFDESIKSTKALLMELMEDFAIDE